MFLFKVRDKTDILTRICSAMESRQIIEFSYHGVEIRAEPYCLGIVLTDKADNEGLLCYQVDIHSELEGAVGWKLYRASEISDLRITNRVFSSDRAGYSLDNLRWKTIYCCISADKNDAVEPEILKEPSIDNLFHPVKDAIPANIDTEPEEPKEVPIPTVVTGIKHATIKFADAHARKLDTTTETAVKVEKSRRLFTPSYIRMIKLSRKLNQNKNISGDIYFHPTERKIIVKSIDLNLPNTFCEVNTRPRAGLNERNRQLGEKRWLEAYLVNRAKHNNWNLELQRNEYRFLLSQLKFRRDVNKGEKKGKVLDLLLYDDEKKYLVAMELRSRADIAVMNTAHIELGDLVTKLKEVVETGDIALAFGLEEIKGIFAYLVWPKADVKHDLGKYGLIEFDRIESPWERYKESGKELEIRFSSEKSPSNLL